MTAHTKRCPKCGETKAVGEFSPGNSRCKPCKSAQGQARYWASDEYREQRKQYHRANEQQKRADPERNAVILQRLREKRATNAEWRERTTAAVNARRRQHLGRHMAISARKRAKARSIACTITPEWVQQLWDRDPQCAYCGRKLRCAERAHAHDSATLERIDSAVGYTPDNTVLACYRCNTLKNDASLEELEQLVANVRRVRDLKLCLPLIPES